MFKGLLKKWEVVFLAKGGRLSDHEKLIVKDFANWLDWEVASGEIPDTGDLQDILGDCPAGTNWASRPEYQSREA